MLLRKKPCNQAEKKEDRDEAKTLIMWPMVLRSDRKGCSIMTRPDNLEAFMKYSTTKASPFQSGKYRFVEDKHHYSTAGKNTQDYVNSRYSENKEHKTMACTVKSGMVLQ